MKLEGSLINRLMECNQTMPVIGKGGTAISYSDRDAFEVVSVSPDNKSCRIQYYKHERIDDNGMSESQTYKYETLEGPIHILKFQRNSWYEERETIRWTPAFTKEVMESLQYATDDVERENFRKKFRDEIYDAETGELKLVNGKTRLCKIYNKFPVIFGVKDTYYDYSF